MRLRTIATATLIVVATASMAFACSVPVFRYALEHWRPDPYVVFVFHSGDLTTEHQAVVDSMQSKGANGNLIANVIVKVVDIDADSDAVTQQIRRDHQFDKLPWMVVLSPPKWGAAQTTWQGEFTADNAAIVMDSPARAQISRKLIDGDSVVWVLLECGRKEEDDNAFDVLAAELRKLESTIKLPEIEVEDLGDLSVAPDALKVAFSAIRVSRDDAKERVLVETLLRVESDLLEEPQVSQPMAFPVFGRGRVLYALVGKGIAPDVIEEACQFLTGGCQCTVKAQNPGVDLIINVDWDEVVVPTESLDKDLPPLAGFSGFGRRDGGLDRKDAEVDADVRTSNSGVTEAIHTDPKHPASAGIGISVLFVLTILVVVVVVATVYLIPRTN
ncbi:MAG: hypothetical protein WKF77_23070 [Planctomycetaceae bacterium]